MGERTIDDLRQKQALPLEVKILLTRERVRQWVNEYGEDGVYISFSGGKDSTVLMDLVRNRFGYKNVTAAFVDVPTQYPELKAFVKTFDNVDIIKPKLGFNQVCEKYGFPLISKEVSECVGGARSYLKKIRDKMEDLDKYPYGLDCVKRITGSGEYKKGADILAEAHLQSIKDGERHPYNYETDRILGTCEKSIQEAVKATDARTLKDIARLIIESGTEKQTTRDTQNLMGWRSPNPGELHPTEGIYDLNLYAAMLMGVYTIDFGKNRKAEVKPKEFNRSMYNQERYQFFLDAPFEISHMCCRVMKKAPIHDYAKRTGRKPITAQMAEESRLRTQQWIKNGCNGFQMKSPISNPMSFWTENDVLQYIAENNLPICSVYGQVVEDYGDQLEGQMDLSDYGLAENQKRYKTTGCKRTGCMLCGFGCHLEKPGEGRFERLRETHPKMYQALDLIKNNGVTFREAIEWTNEHGGLNIPL